MCTVQILHMYDTHIFLFINMYNTLEVHDAHCLYDTHDLHDTHIFVILNMYNTLDMHNTYFYSLSTTNPLRLGPAWLRNSSFAVQPNLYSGGLEVVLRGLRRCC